MIFFPGANPKGLEIRNPLNLNFSDICVWECHRLLILCTLSFLSIPFQFFFFFFPNWIYLISSLFKVKFNFVLTQIYDFRHGAEKHTSVFLLSLVDLRKSSHQKYNPDWCCWNISLSWVTWKKERKRYH